jgi:hypothetical protein
MTNKRITELTALDGDDVADNDVLAIVDVSDTTMAASGTTKKITVAELVTDSALTNKFWPNSTTALTGANLANGDKLAVVDVGSPDVAKYITADELAQGSQFTSRYVAKSGDEIWIEGSRFVGRASAASTETTINDTPGHSFSSSLTNIAGWSIRIPSWWSTFHVDMFWTNNGSGETGNVRWLIGYGAFSDGELVDGTAAYLSAPANYAAPTYQLLKVQRMATSISRPAEDLVAGSILRDGADGGDTLNAAAVVFGLLFTRAS